MVALAQHRPTYLVVLKEGSTGAFTVDELTPEDLAQAAVGIADIIRLADLARLDNGVWIPTPAGILTTPEIPGGPNEPFHIHPALSHQSEPNP